VVAGTFYMLNISFKHGTGDYLDAEHLLKPLENIPMRWQRELHKHDKNDCGMTNTHIYEIAEKSPQ
jgi:hypothetical protein